MGTTVLLEQVLKGLREGTMLPTTQGGSIFLEAAGAGKGVDDNDLALINEWTRNPVNSEQVYTFPALAIDEQTTRNYVRYTAASQRASVSRWVGVPFLFNEDSQWASLFDGSDHSLKASSQMGRIYKSQLVKTPEGFIGTLVHVYSVKGLDEKVDSFIARVDAGLLREVSIHVMVPEGAKCNICKQMYPCSEGHQLAQDYDGTTCTVDTVGALVPIELSSVACPGSVVAHIMPDAERADYKVIALREALGGSRQLQEMPVEHKAEACTENECKEEACQERIAALAEANHDAETCESTDCANAKCVEKRKKVADEDEDDSEEAFHIVGAKEECPACGRTEAAAPSQAPANLEAVQSDFKERLNTLVEGTKKKISEATQAREAAEARAANFDAMFGEYVESTVELAISRGTKEAADTDAYREELAQQGFAAVKLVREALKAAPAVATRQEKVDRLRTSAAERAKSAPRTTQVVATENGGVQTYIAPRLG